MFVEIVNFLPIRPDSSRHRIEGENSFLPFWEGLSSTGGVILLGLALTVVTAQGCGPAIPKEELGEIVHEVPPEFHFDRPYPVPWAGDAKESQTDEENFQLDEKLEKPSEAESVGDSAGSLGTGTDSPPSPHQPTENGGQSGR